MKAAAYDYAGGPDVLRYIDLPEPRCPPNGVVIRVKAISIEGGDLVSRASISPPMPDFVPGYAAAGVIEAVGNEVTDRTVGQRVASFGFSGSHAELRQVHPSQTWVVPDDLDLGRAAALPISFGTAFHALFDRGALERGQSVLVQAAAGGVGLAAVQLAHRAGARVFATVSGATRAARLAELGAEHVIDYRLNDVAAEVMRLTGDRGCDLVIDPVGSTLTTSLEALRPEGRLVFVGNAGGGSLQLNLWPALQSNQSLHGVFMGTQFEKPTVHRAVANMLADAAAGRLEVVIDRTFHLDQVRNAHAYAEENPILGRVVILP